jgi:hypothetical protein
MTLTEIQCSQKLGCLNDLVISIELEKRSKELRNKMQESLELQPGLEKKTRDKIKSNEHSINNNTDYKRRLLALI